jgi:hypothetical protein
MGNLKPKISKTGIAAFGGLVAFGQGLLVVLTFLQVFGDAAPQKSFTAKGADAAIFGFSGH